MIRQFCFKNQKITENPQFIVVKNVWIVVVTKYDGDLVPAARRIAMEYTSALKYMRPRNTSRSNSLNCNVTFYVFCIKAANISSILLSALEILLQQ